MVQARVSGLGASVAMGKLGVAASTPWLAKKLTQAIGVWAGAVEAGEEAPINLGVDYVPGAKRGAFAAKCRAKRMHLGREKGQEGPCHQSQGQVQGPVLQDLPCRAQASHGVWCQGQLCEQRGAEDFSFSPW